MKNLRPQSYCIRIYVLTSSSAISMYIKIWKTVIIHLIFFNILICDQMWLCQFIVLPKGWKFFFVIFVTLLTEHSFFA